jgi:hypothetical protein
MAKTYRIGELDMFREPEEEVYTEEVDAEAAAIMLSYGDIPIGIWDEDGEIVGIVWQQQTFRP